MERHTGEGVIWPDVGSSLCMGRDPLIVFHFLCLCHIRMKVGETFTELYGLIDLCRPVSLSSLEKSYSPPRNGICDG